MKKKKSMHGALADKNNPVSMNDILHELKEARIEDDESELEDVLHLSEAWEKYRKNNHLKGTFNAYVDWLRAIVE